MLNATAFIYLFIYFYFISIYVSTKSAYSGMMHERNYVGYIAENL